MQDTGKQLNGFGLNSSIRITYVTYKSVARKRGKGEW
jgi:hypothetical protein